jgi:hypothetical protein
MDLSQQSCGVKVGINGPSLSVRAGPVQVTGTSGGYSTNVSGSPGASSPTVRTGPSGPGLDVGLRF